MCNEWYYIPKQIIRDTLDFRRLSKDNDKEVIQLYFPSKKDIWFFLLIWGSVLAINLLPIFLSEPSGTQFISSDSLAGRILGIIITAPMVWIWFKTGYTIEDGKIKTRFGPIKTTIEIAQIKKINKRKNPFTAPALSVDRIEILFGNYDVVCLSPKNERAFVETLVKENPNIQVDEQVTHSK